jgi:predicted ATPase
VTGLHIKELRLRNYRSFRDARLPLSDLTFLVGRNASGKSSLLDALDFIREALTDSLPIAIERRGGMEALRHRLAAEDELVEVAVVLNVTRTAALADIPGVQSDNVGRAATETCSAVYGISLDAKGIVVRELLGSNGGFLPGFRRSRSNLQFVGEMAHWDLSLPDDVLVLPMVSGRGVAEDRQRSSAYGSGPHLLFPQLVQGSLSSFRSSRPTSTSIIEGRELAVGDVLTPDARNLADVVHFLRERVPERFESILAGLRTVTPGIENVDTVTIAGRRHLQFHQSLSGRSFVFQVSSMSDGTLRALALLCALHQPRSASLVTIDEIEDALHVGALFAIVEQALAVTEAPSSPERSAPTQVLMTTHSTEVLSLPMATGERIRILENRDGASWIFALSPEVIADLQPPETVGRLLRINALWPDETPLINGADLFALPV